MLFRSYPDVYPTAEVVTLKKILKHNDIVHCQSPFFNVFEIPTILVLGYDFPQTQGASNVQEYSITAVYEKTIEALKFETRNLNEILSAREAIQSEIEERERILQLNNETINSNSRVTVKDLLNKVNPKLYVQQQSWL